MKHDDDDFPLDPVLARDTLPVTRLPLSLVRLMDNRHFPWLILVPSRQGAREWIDLEREEQHQLSDEIAIVSHIAQALFTPHKLNIAALGNQVPQLHVHLIARYPQDRMWPKPVWGGPSDPYEPGESDGIIRELKVALDSLF